MASQLQWHPFQPFWPLELAAGVTPLVAGRKVTVGASSAALASCFGAFSASPLSVSLRAASPGSDAAGGGATVVASSLEGFSPFEVAEI